MADKKQTAHGQGHGGDEGDEGDEGHGHPPVTRRVFFGNIPQTTTHSEFQEMVKNTAGDVEHIKGNRVMGSWGLRFVPLRFVNI